MHELSICQALIDRVEAIARSERSARVLSIKVEIGPLSGVEANLLQRAFPLAAHGSLAEEASLLTTVGDVRVRCTRCGSETAARPNRLLCGSCGDWRIELLSGDELLLASVELEKTGPHRAVA